MLRRRVVAIVLVGSATLAACSTTKRSDDSPALPDNPVAAGPAVSPPAARTPAGAVFALKSPIISMAADPRSKLLAVAVDRALLLYPMDNPAATPKTIALPATPHEVRLAGSGGSFLASIGNGTLLRVGLPGGDLTATPVTGAPVSAAELGAQTLVAVRDNHNVAVVDGGAVRRVLSGDLASADQVLAAGDRAVVLDRLRNGVFELNVAGGKIGQGLAAGEGATNAVADRFGRVLVADTRGGALLAFSLDPLLMRQRYPVAGAPFAVAYDPTRDMVWVTLTATNEIVGYQVAGEEPRERFRFPTLTQPNSVTVDPAGGRVFVGSASGEGIQVISL